MKVLIVLAAYLLNSAMADVAEANDKAAVNEKRYNGLRVKYGPSAEGADSSYFFSIPRNMFEAVEQGWELVQFPPPWVKPYLHMLCPPGRVICPLYEESGRIAGMLIAVPEYLYELLAPEDKFLLWKPERLLHYWTITHYYVTHGRSFSGKPSLTEFGTLRENGIWVTDPKISRNEPDSSVVWIPISEAELNSTSYRRQQCIPNMGNHYYLNMSPELECEDLFPWFPITNKEELIGVGFMMFGRLVQPKGLRKDYFEIPPSRNESPTPFIPDAPQCLWDWQEKYGLLTMHIYFVDDPWNIRCDD